MLSSFWEGSTQVSTRTMSIRSLCAAVSLAAAVSFAAVVSCTVQPSLDFTCDELSLIHGADSIMRVLTIDNPADSFVLRDVSTDLSAEALLSEDFAKLSGLMIATVTHPSQDGVGIAAPQVGINRRVVAVQRFDKEGEPFEFFVNPEIVEMGDEWAVGGEGCLSVPEISGPVERAQSLVLRYRDAEFVEHTEHIEGFTAVIFQHEIDHLNGTLFIDKMLPEDELMEEELDEEVE